MSALNTYKCDTEKKLEMQKLKILYHNFSRLEIYLFLTNTLKTIGNYLLLRNHNWKLMGYECLKGTFLKKWSLQITPSVPLDETNIWQ